VTTAGSVSLADLFSAFAAKDTANYNTISTKDFNELSAELGVEGVEGSVVEYADGLVTFKEACDAAGIVMPGLPISINGVVECFRKVSDSGPTANLAAFAQKIKLYSECDVNPEDKEVSFEDAIKAASAASAEPMPLKLNVLKDAIRRWGKDGNGYLKPDELGQFARFYEIPPKDIKTDLEELMMADLLLLKAFELPKDHPIVQTAIPMNDVRKAFDWGDADHNGVLSAQELGRCLRLAGQNPSQSEIKKMMQMAQEERGGEFDFDAFTDIACKSYIPVADQVTRAKEAFSVFDEDGSGSISLAELRRIMTTYGEDMSPEEVKELFDTLDTDGDGKLNIDEFVELLVS